MPTSPRSSDASLFVVIPFEKRLFPNLYLPSLELSMNGEKPNTDKVIPILEKEGIDIRSLDISQSFEEKTVRMRIVVQVLEEIDWKSLYKKLGDLEDISKISLDQKIRAPPDIPRFPEGRGSPGHGSGAKPFRRSLAEVLPHAAEKSVAVLIEATNRYESSVANTIEEAAACLQPYGAAYAQLLPDTFHMNIEEANMFASLDRHRERFRSFHLSDNTRFFPGFGAIDFDRILRFLMEIGYRGQLAIEGNVRADIEGELRACVARLAPLLEMQDG